MNINLEDSIFHGSIIMNEPQRIASLTSIFKHREDSIKFLIRKFKCEHGVELGTRYSEFAMFLLANTSLNKLSCIDIHEPTHKHILELRFGERYKFVHGSSLEVQTLFKDESLDFVYHDSCHREDFVWNELNIWWPKAAKGALICGDDYLDITMPGEGTFGVINSVNRFCKQYNLQLYLTGTNELALDKQKEFGHFQGEELLKKINHQPNMFVTVPNWYLIKS